MPDQIIIPEFSPPWECFRNFHPSPIIIQDEEYDTVEHAYQAYKTLNPVEREYVRNAPTPREAKKRGRHVTLREDFPIVRIPLMRLFVLTKFTRHRRCRQVLTLSHDAIIQEGNWWGDTFWGICNGKGENNLGIILMEVRNIVSFIR
jgi:ribA/ribD-fused uncharacterized protein